MKRPSAFPSQPTLRLARSSVRGRAGTLLRVTALLLLGAGRSQAHDPYVCTTDIWLRPDNCEVDVVMNPTLYRRLLDSPPSAELTDDNFDSVYRPLLVKCAPAMLELTVDGAKLEPRYVEVTLPDETDLQFTFIYERPTGTKFHLDALFVKKMDAGFMNSLIMLEGGNFLGYGEQTADHPGWEINLPEGAGWRAPSNSPVTAQSGSRAVDFSYACATLASVIAIVILISRKKSP